MAEASGSPLPGGDDGLGRLQERLDRASEAAERLISEAAAGVIRRPPPAGWQAPGGEPGSGGATGEFELLLDAIGSLRDRIPPELQRRLGEALRELLLAVRALIDWYLERSERRPRERGDVLDIPIL